MRLRAYAFIFAATVAACGPSARPVDQGSSVSATPTSTPTSTSTSSATPAVRSAIAVEPAATTALSPTRETVVDPASTFQVELVHRLPDARVVLVDAADAHVAAKDIREVAATTRLTLAPEAPLTPGSRYVLRVDGASVREMHDADGRAFAPIGFPVLVAGAPPPPEAKKPPKKRHRRR